MPYQLLEKVNEGTFGKWMRGLKLSTAEVSERGALLKNQVKCAFNIEYSVRFKKDVSGSFSGFSEEFVERN